MGSVHAECAAVCLDNQKHGISTDLRVQTSSGKTYRIVRPAVTAQMIRTYDDLQDATELGASGVALLLAREETGLTAIQRSRKGTGFDYWLGPGNQNDDELPFQRSARLEVSGILKGTDNQVTARIRQKLRQTDPSDGLRLSAYAVVVEFGQPMAQISKK